MMTIAKGGHSNDGDTAKGRNPASVVKVVMST